jgi:hypothetical protein
MATLSKLRLQPALVCAARTGSTSYSGSAIDLAGTINVGGRQVKALLDVGAVTTAGSLDVKFQEDTTSGFTSPTDISGAAFTQVTTSTGSEEIHFRATKRYVRAYAAVEASTNGYTFGVYLLTELRVK